MSKNKIISQIKPEEFSADPLTELLRNGRSAGFSKFQQQLVLEGVEYAS